MLRFQSVELDGIQSASALNRRWKLLLKHRVCTSGLFNKQLCLGVFSSDWKVIQQFKFSQTQGEREQPRSVWGRDILGRHKTLLFSCDPEPRRHSVSEPGYISAQTSHTERFPGELTVKFTWTLRPVFTMQKSRAQLRNIHSNWTHPLVPPPHFFCSNNQQFTLLTRTA